MRRRAPMVPDAGGGSPRMGDADYFSLRPVGEPVFKKR